MKNIGDFVLYLINFFAGISAMILSFFFVITLTKTKYIPKYKTVLGIVIYVLGFIIIANIFTLSPISNFISSLTSRQNIIFEIIIIGIFAVILYFLTVYLIDHKIEVE